MGKRFDYEYMVIGGGVAGITAATQLAEAGRKVAIVEQGKLGGAHVYHRDVPQRALFTFSHLYADAVSGSRFGISSTSLRYNYPTVQHWKDRAISRCATAKKNLEDLGVTIIKGKAHFVGNYDVTIGGKNEQVSANKFLIATGAELDPNKISGVDNVSYYTPATILDLERPPKAVLIIGGGASGCEVAQYLAELGAKVVIVESSARLLQKEEPEVGKLMEEYLSKRLGIKVFTHTRATALEKDKISPRVVFMRGGQERTVRVETIVLATGSKPSLDFGLQNAGVSFDKNGIIVDKTLQSSARNIFVAGDALGGDSSTERAIYSAEIAVMNMLGHNKTFVNYDGFMRVTDTNPQVASVGITEEIAIKEKKKYKKAVVPLSAADVSTTEDFRIGFIKILADLQDKIIGATLVAPHAADTMQELALAIRHGLPLVQVASTPHPANEWSNLIKIAARKILLSASKK